MEKHNGEFQIMLDHPPDHPDSILLGAADNAMKESSNLPSQARLLSRSEIIENYKRMFEACDDKKYLYIRKTIIAHIPQFTRKPPELLSPTSLSDMWLDQIHKGRFIVCKVIHHSIRMVAIQAAVEDKNGDVADLALYNYFETKGMTRSDISSLLPVDTVIIIREPWFKLGATGGHPTIRVDSPKDISFPTHKELLELDIPSSWRPSESLTAEDYEQIGNKAHEKDRFEAAVRAYTSGLSIDPSASLLRLNRLWCHLKLGNYSHALEDARIVLEDQSLTPEHLAKARYRMALVYYAQDRFSDALAALEQETIPGSCCARLQARPRDLVDGETTAGGQIPPEPDAYMRD
ncbi:hypothetical protein RhiJN_00004 [Ceratobasidium sp. AG-Ba]|nr:hypothetical protein RhiJN_00004 [Ceratobasidium sp. AG-Ba]